MPALSDGKPGRVPPEWRKGVAHLCQVDPTLGARLRARDWGALRCTPPSSRYAELIRIVLWQQLSWKAAQAIHARFLERFGGTVPDPGRLASVPIPRLRAAGLSRQKALSLKGLARHVVSGALPLAHLGRMSDDRVVETITRMRGFGRWSADMFLIFQLGRLDVFPVGDLGIRKAVQRLYRLRALPGTDRMLEISEPWRPYRTVATWHLWRMLDG